MGYVPSSEDDIFFGCASNKLGYDNFSLKNLITTSTVVLACNEETYNIKAITTELERVTYQIFIIAKEVAQLKYSRDWMIFYISFIVCIILKIKIFLTYVEMTL